jgi:hypothetical protein
MLVLNNVLPEIAAWDFSFRAVFFIAWCRILNSTILGMNGE